MQVVAFLSVVVDFCGVVLSFTFECHLQRYHSMHHFLMLMQFVTPTVPSENLGAGRAVTGQYLSATFV
jgi:hypothetical protein